MKRFEELTQEAVELLSRLIETPRVSHEEKEAADLLEAWMKERSSMLNTPPYCSAHT